MKRWTDGMLTRRQLLEAAALGLTGCLAAGCSRPGHGHALSGAAERATGLRVAAGTDTINATNAAAGATALATRLEPPAYHKPVVASFPQCWRPGDLILQGDRTGPRTVAITSDDGPWPHNTVAMMNHMRDAGLEANGGLVQFFMVGNNVVNFADVARQVVDRGYGIANHSLTTLLIATQIHYVAPRNLHDRK